MAIHLHCLTSDGGVPLFSKSSHTSQQLAFPIVASLNGIQMFARNHGVDLVSTDAGNYRTIWKVYNQCLTLVLLCEELDADVEQLTVKLDLIYHALLLMCGYEELKNLKNVDRLKKQLRLASRLCGALLDEEDLPLFSDVTGAVDLAVCPDQSQPVLQSCLETFAELSSSSSYSCLLAQGKTVVATRKWFALSATEKVLLSLLVYSQERVSANEMLVYLPNLSPEVPHRLLCLELVPGVVACVLTGTKPPLAQLHLEVARYWRPVFESLKSLTRIEPRNLPQTLTLDPNLLGLIMINLESGRSLSSVQPHDNSRKANDDVISVDRRRYLLRHLYRTVKSEYFTQDDTHNDDPRPSLRHRACEVYLVEEEYKFYAMRTETMEIYLLFSTDIPSLALRSVSQKTLYALTKDKSIII